jgi:NAD-dependent DNA ligase
MDCIKGMNNKVRRYNEEFIDLMDKLHNIMMKHGEPFRAKAYQKAQDSIMKYPNDILALEQVKDLPGIGSTIYDKLKEYVETETLRILENEKTNPIHILTDIYGVGPKKAEELVKMGIKTIPELRQRQDEVLNDIQKIGLQFYEDILERIPRSEIEEFETLFKQIFGKIKTIMNANTSDKSINDKFEIVGSYRRGALHSGDIDVIITGSTGDAYKMLIDELIKHKIIMHVLSRGPSKTLVIAQLGKNRTARRIDFLYAPPDEFAFAILYFTGSKIFNTVMRQKALDLGYTFNEHGIYYLTQNKKGEKVNQMFENEKAIFDFLGLTYKTPIERQDGRAVCAYIDVGSSPLLAEKCTPTLMKVASYMDVGTSSEKCAPTSMKVVAKNTTRKKKVLPKDEKQEGIDSNPGIIEKIIEQFVTNGIQILETLNEQQLSDILRYASKKYYNQTPIMTDNQYDIIKDFVEVRFPLNKAIYEVGAEVERNKVSLPYEMASMDKIKPDTNALSNWSLKFTGPYILSCKLDGVSGLYTTEGKTPKLYTRGNGTVGQDISHLIPHLRLPKTKGIVIRGEFIISKAVFKSKYATKFANSRNMVAGIINHKTVSDAVHDLDFVAYEVIKPELPPSQQMELLKTQNINPVLFNTTNKLSNEMLSDLLVEWRQNYVYEIDGIIVTNDKTYARKSGNPDHAFAFKMVLSDQIAEAIVVDVLWSPSKDGYLKPRVQIEPIHLGGVTIEYATGFNAAFIKDNNIGIGATIQLIRSGDVIPHIKSVIIQAPQPKMPSVAYKWNDTNVDILLVNAIDDPTVKEKNITGFFKGIGVEGLSSGNITRIIEAGYDTVTKIMNMSETDFLKVEGFKNKMANKIYTGIRDKIQEADIITIMSASNIFGRGFSDKKIELILTEIPDILVSNKSEQQKIVDLTGKKGMAQKTAEAFVSRIEDFKLFLKEAGLENKLNIQKTATKIADTSHPLYQKTIVLTGTRDKVVMERLKEVGAILGSTVSKNTFVVVAKTVDDDTSKAEEARKLNIPIMSVEEFIQKYVSK